MERTQLCCAFWIFLMLCAILAISWVACCSSLVSQFVPAVCRHHLLRKPKTTGMEQHADNHPEYPWMLLHYCIFLEVDMSMARFAIIGRLWALSLVSLRFWHQTLWGHVSPGFIFPHPPNFVTEMGGKACSKEQKTQVLQKLTKDNPKTTTSLRRVMECSSQLDQQSFFAANLQHLCRTCPLHPKFPFPTFTFATAVML